MRKSGKLLVIAFRKHLKSLGLRTLREGPETPTQWKGAGDAYAS